MDYTKEEIYKDLGSLLRTYYSWNSGVHCNDKDPEQEGHFVLSLWDKYFPNGSEAFECPEGIISDEQWKELRSKIFKKGK